MKNFPPYPLLLEPTCLLNLKKNYSYPFILASLFINIQENFQPFWFFTYTNEKFSTLPAVIRASPLIKFRKEFQSTLLLEPPLVLETQEYQNWKLHLVFASLSKSLMTRPHLLGTPSDEQDLGYSFFNILFQSFPATVFW